MQVAFLSSPAADSAASEEKKTLYYPAQRNHAVTGVELMELVTIMSRPICLAEGTDHRRPQQNPRTCNSERLLALPCSVRSFAQR